MVRTGEPSVAELMAQLAANAAEIAALKAEKEALSQRIVKLEEEIALARLHRFAPHSEKHVDRLFNEAEQLAGEDEDDDVIDLPDTGLPLAERPEGKKRGRRPLSENLPRERVEHDLPDDQKACPCCHHQMHRMGEAVIEQLHIEVKAKVLQHVRFKYACRNCDRTGINTPVIIAPMPAQPLPGSIAMASTLAFALVHKYVDGTPLYRLSQGFERAGVPVSRSALGYWVIGSSQMHLSRIYDALKLLLGLQPLIHGDETTVRVLKEKDREADDTSYMWAYRSGVDSDEPIVLFDYQPGRGQIHIRRFRQQHSVPILNALKKWFDDIARKVLPDSKLGDAIFYTLNQWDYLTRYTEDGRMPIDNNLLERDISIFATGKIPALQRHRRGG